MEQRLELQGGLKARNLGGTWQGGASGLQEGRGWTLWKPWKSPMGQGCGVDMDSQDSRDKESSWAWRRQEDTGEEEVQGTSGR